MLLPFIAGMAIAYFLDPMADWLEEWRAPRWLATTIVLLFFVLVVVAAVLVVVPVIQAQVVDFVDALPRYQQAIRARVMPLVDRLFGQLSQEEVEKLRAAAGERAGQAVSWLGTVLGGLWSGGLALFNVLSLLVITPVVAFYLLRDWDKMISRVDQWLPRQHAETIRVQAKEIDRTLAGFVRGQALVCLILGTFYGIALTVVGLNFGLLVGLGAGLLSFIPYVGSIIGFLSSVGIALVQYDSYGMVAVVAGIFFLGQAVEGNFLTPKLVGDRIGLHPVWVIFALLAGASLFGFVGVLLAVPVAAALGVLVRFALCQYLDSRYYKGSAEGAADE
jgi:predicted PurR-regulated permease PerM